MNADGLCCSSAVGTRGELQLLAIPFQRRLGKLGSTGQTERPWLAKQTQTDATDVPNIDDLPVTKAGRSKINLLEGRQVHHASHRS